MSVYLGFLRAQARSLRRLFVAALVYAGLTFLEPLFYLVFIDEVVLKTNLTLLALLGVTIVGVGGAQAYLYGVVKYWRVRLGQLLLRDVRRAVVARVLAQPPAWLRKNPPGELVALTVAEVDALDALHDAIFWGAATTAGILVMIAFCLAVDARLALLLVTPIPLVAGLLVVLDRYAQRRNAHALAIQARLVGFLKLRCTHVATVQAFGAEERELAAMTRVADDLVAARAGTEVIVQIMERLYDAAHWILLGGLLMLAGRRIIVDGDLSLGALAALYGFAERITAEVKDGLNYVVRGRVALAALDRVSKVLALAPPAALAPMPAVEPPRARGAIQLDDVWFRHEGTDADVLRGLSLQVRPGESVAVVGLSGAGKSTLFQLLFRYHDPSRGAIRIDGHDTRSMPVAALRGQLAIASQDPVLFDLSVADNVRYARPDASDAEVQAALDAALAGELVGRMPHGAATMVGEGGVSVSGGERQRLALARIILRDAPILLLDEVTAALDPSSAKSIDEAVFAYARGRTTLVITHNLATAMRCDRVVVLEGGRVVESGAHADLVARGGLYATLYEAQFGAAFRDANRPAAPQAPLRLRPARRPRRSCAAHLHSV
jgi:ATP-binding cassette subfamily B protein